MKRQKFATVETELTNYYNHSAAAVGFKCGYSSFIAQMYGKEHSLYEDPMTDGCLAHISRNRKTYQKLNTMSPILHRVLDATYNIEYPWNDLKAKLSGHALTFQPVYFQKLAPMVAVFGRLSGALIVSNLLSLVEIQTLCHKKLKKKLSPDEEKTMFLIRVAADKLFETAHQEFISLSRVQNER